MVLPPNKRQKAPKRAWTRCPSSFSQSLRVQQVAPTSLSKGGKKVILFFSARFSRFINSLKPQCTDVHCGYFFSLFIILCFFCFALGCIPIILCEWVEAFLLLPNFLCFRCPILSIEVTLCAKFICTFALNKVC